jgi:hypothetical protein
MDQDQHPQEKKRGHRTFLDQHGRKWGGIINGASRLWVMPLHPKFSAPFIPPSKYVQPVQNDSSEIYIDYQHLYNDLVESQAAYEQRFMGLAMDKYTDTFETVLNKPTKWLRDAAGIAPIHPDVARACISGNRWILGFSDQKPDWAWRFFPKEEDVALLSVSEFPDVEDETPAEAISYPHQVEVGVWILSNQEKVRGSRSDALMAEAAVLAFAETLETEQQDAA